MNLHKQNHYQDCKTAPAFFRPGQSISWYYPVFPGNPLFLFDRVADLRYELIRVLCLVGADVIDV